MNETNTEPLQSLKNETKPRLIAHESRKQDQDYTNVSFINETYRSKLQKLNFLNKTNKT